jgi:hypothetical protein
MPKKLTDFIISLAKAAGIPDSNEQIIKIKEALKDIDPEIDPVFENVIHTNLMNEAAAKNNPNLNSYFEGQLKSKLWAQALGPMDDNILEAAKNLEIEDLESLKSEKDTRKRLSLLTEKLKDNFEKKGKSKTEKIEIEAERAALNAKIKQLTEEVENVRKEEHGKLMNELKEINLNSMLSSYQYGLPKEIPQDVVIETAKTLVNRKLKESKMQVNYSPDSKQLDLVNETGQIPYNNNAPVLFKEFVDKVLAEGNLLQVSGGSREVNTTKKETTQPIVDSGQSSISELMNSQLSAFKKS